jgi:hypothetical protein
MNENSLEVFSRGSQMLAEANTIQKVKDLKDLALTAADWARRVGAGEAAITLAKAYAFDAEHRMGEMLKETELNKGAQGIGKSAVQPVDRTPTLADIGISKNESARAQKVAALPDETFEELKQGKITIKKAMTEIKQGAEIKKVYEIKEEKESETLIGLKRYWKEAKKKDKKEFLLWVKSRKEL